MKQDVFQPAADANLTRTIEEARRTDTAKRHVKSLDDWYDAQVDANYNSIAISCDVLDFKSVASNAGHRATGIKMLEWLLQRLP